MTLSIGALIWISVRPLLSRLWLSAAFGFVLTKADLFSLAASRGTGQIVLNVTLPCLMFSKIVPAFTPQNIGNLGVLVAMAFLYEALGFLAAWATKRLFWVPHRFRYGILCAGTISNYSDIPTAVITSITANIPFNASTDQNISVAYVAGFILVFFTSLFPLGAHRLVAMDFEGPDIEDEEVRVLVSQRTSRNVRGVMNAFRHLPFFDRATTSADASYPSDEEKAVEVVDDTREEMHVTTPAPDATAVHPEEHKLLLPPLPAYFVDEETVVASTEAGYSSRKVSRVPSLAPSQDRSHGMTDSVGSSRDEGEPRSAAASMNVSSQRRPLKLRLWHTARSALRSFLLPCSITIVVSIIIAVIAPLKALFTPVLAPPGSNSNSNSTTTSAGSRPTPSIPNAPDGQPPLSLILDCATFVGAASVPLGLLCLGAAVARVRLPRRGEWGNLPLGAIAWLSVTKMLVLPLVAVLLCEGALVRVGFIDKGDKVLRFVCMFMSVVPTATSQVYLTQVYSGTGEAGILPFFLIPQYILMFFSMTLLIAYSLSVLF